MHYAFELLTFRSKDMTQKRSKNGESFCGPK
jgi:hypothetical protein